MLPRIYQVNIQGDFKDGRLTEAMKAAGIKFYENFQNVVLPDQVVWIPERLYEMMKNSGAAMEVVQARNVIPEPTGPTSEAKEEPEGDEELEGGEERIPLTLDDLKFTGPAKRAALDYDVSPEELLENLGEWELSSGAWADHKFTLADVKALREV